MYTPEYQSLSFLPIPTCLYKPYLYDVIPARVNIKHHPDQMNKRLSSIFLENKHHTHAYTTQSWVVRQHLINSRLRSIYR